jgi:hypothetical protein
MSPDEEAFVKNWHVEQKPKHVTSHSDFDQRRTTMKYCLWFLRKISGWSWSCRQIRHRDSTRSSAIAACVYLVVNANA